MTTASTSVGPQTVLHSRRSTAISGRTRQPRPSRPSLVKVLGRSQPEASSSHHPVLPGPRLALTFWPIPRQGCWFSAVSTDPGHIRVPPSRASLALFGNDEAPAVPPKRCWFVPSTPSDWRASQLTRHRWDAASRFPEGPPVPTRPDTLCRRTVLHREMGSPDFARLDLGRRPPRIRASSNQVPSTTNVFPAGAFRTSDLASKVRNASRDLATPDRKSVV